MIEKDYFCIMKKGRNKELIVKRDLAVCRRYYYWTEIQRLRFDDTLKVLSSQEFFLSEETILKIIRKCTHKISEIPTIQKIKTPRLTAAQLALFIELEPQNHQ